jgi:hypothetical protein
VASLLAIHFYIKKKRFPEEYARLYEEINVTRARLLIICPGLDAFELEIHGGLDVRQI